MFDPADHVPAITEALSKQGSGTKATKMSALKALHVFLVSERNEKDGGIPSDRRPILDCCRNDDDKQALQDFQESRLSESLQGPEIGKVFIAVGPLSRLMVSDTDGAEVPTEQDAAVKNVLAVYEKACDKVAGA